MKKLLLTLGTTIAIAAPVASVVACGSYQNHSVMVMTEKGIFNYMNKHSADFKVITQYQGQTSLSVRTLAEASSDVLERAVNAPLNDDAKVFALVNLSKDELLKVVKASPENGVQILRDKYENLIKNVREELKRKTVSEYHFAIPIVEGWEGIVAVCNSFIFEDISFKNYDDRQELYDLINKNL